MPRPFGPLHGHSTSRTSLEAYADREAAAEAAEDAAGLRMRPTDLRMMGQLPHSTSLQGWAIIYDVRKLSLSSLLQIHATSQNSHMGPNN